MIIIIMVIIVITIIIVKVNWWLQICWCELKISAFIDGEKPKFQTFSDDKKAWKMTIQCWTFNSMPIVMVWVTAFASLFVRNTQLWVEKRTRSVTTTDQFVSTDPFVCMIVPHYLRLPRDLQRRWARTIRICKCGPRIITHDPVCGWLKVHLADICFLATQTQTQTARSINRKKMEVGGESARHTVRKGPFD